MGWAIATPSRDLSPGGDRSKAWPMPLGGDTGIIDIPQTDAANRGEGIMRRPDTKPPTDYASGAVDEGPQSLPPFDWSTGGWHGSPRYPMPMPRGLPVTHYLRMFFPNVAGILGFSTTGSSTTEGTTDNNDFGSPAASAPVPFSYKRIVYTLRDLFDRRIYADYWPQERIQASQWPREISKGVRAKEPQMLEPYFPLLTRYTRAGSYGSRTQTIVSPRAAGTPPGAA